MPMADILLADVMPDVTAGMATAGEGALSDAALQPYLDLQASQIAGDAFDPSTMAVVNQGAGDIKQQSGLAGLLDKFAALPLSKQLAYAGIPAIMLSSMAQNRRYQPPGQTPYTGPLSKFSYNPSTYTPYRYQPYAKGGQTSSSSTNDMAAIDNYYAQAQQPDTLPQVLAAAKAGDYNAMIALNKLYQTPNQNYAGGGIPSLGGYSDGGHLLRGPGDGVSDSIPATIGGKQPARLADGEFVVPARIVSELGNGSTEAGARKLYAMMDRIQKARAKTIGKDSMAKDTKAEKYLPT
jgi:hypothetical protein